jgi:hypothetical protein
MTKGGRRRSEIRNQKSEIRSQTAEGGERRTEDRCRGLESALATKATTRIEANVQPASARLRRGRRSTPNIQRRMRKEQLQLPRFGFIRGSPESLSATSRLCRASRHSQFLDSFAPLPSRSPLPSRLFRASRHSQFLDCQLNSQSARSTS